MGKREVFKKNILALTKAKSVDKALQGWKVLRIISLNKRSPVAHCEICGTRFRSGAIMRHQKFNLRISVGGICAEMIHLATLRPSQQQLHHYRQTTWRRFVEHYENRISRGSWIAWIINNAPRKYAGIVADLRYFRAIRSSEDMEKLIEYHDKKRLYPSKALVDIRLLKKLRWPQIPSYLTLIQAQKIIDKIKSMYPAELEVRETRLFSTPRDRHDFNTEIKIAWNKLDDNQRRSAIALIDIMEKDKLPIPNKYEKLYERVITNRSWPLFVWNSHLGLCFINKEDYRSPGRAIIRIYPFTMPAKSYYDLSFFKSLKVSDIKDAYILESHARSLETRGRHV